MTVFDRAAQNAGSQNVGSQNVRWLKVSANERFIQYND